jgi:iron complex outermembrane receptor protein
VNSINRKVFTLIAAAILACATALANDSVTASDPKPADLLQEIVVIATRRPEEISKVPISIVALNQAALAASRIKSVSDLAALVPGIEFDTASGFGPNTLTNVAIRGINSNIGTSTTGIYLDDVPIQSRIVALSYWGNPFPLLFDVAQVEVDRGPQGTLFGAGAEGGAIRFTSPEPNLRDYSGFARTEVSFTRSGGVNYEDGVAAGDPIVTDSVGFCASAWVRRDGGYVDRVDPFTGETVDPNANSKLSYIVRVAVASQLTESIKITPSVFAQFVHNDDSAAYFEYLSDPGAGVYKNGRLLPQPSTERFYLPSLKIEATSPGATITSISAYSQRSGQLTQDATSYDGAVFGSFLSYGNPRGPSIRAHTPMRAPSIWTRKSNCSPKSFASPRLMRGRGYGGRSGPSFHSHRKAILRRHSPRSTP